MLKRKLPNSQSQLLNIWHTIRRRRRRQSALLQAGYIPFTAATGEKDHRPFHCERMLCNICLFLCVPTKREVLFALSIVGLFPFTAWSGSCSAPDLTCLAVLSGGLPPPVANRHAAFQGSQQRYTLHMIFPQARADAGRSAGSTWGVLFLVFTLSPIMLAAHSWWTLMEWELFQFWIALTLVGSGRQFSNLVFILFFSMFSGKLLGNYRLVRDWNGKIFR